MAQDFSALLQQQERVFVIHVEAQKNPVLTDDYIQRKNSSLHTSYL